jgi:hypothetical protein
VCVCVCVWTYASATRICIEASIKDRYTRLDTMHRLPPATPSPPLPPAPTPSTSLFFSFFLSDESTSEVAGADTNADCDTFAAAV